MVQIDVIKVDRVRLVPHGVLLDVAHDPRDFALLAHPRRPLVVLEHAEAGGLDEDELGGVALDLLLLGVEDAGLGDQGKGDAGAFAGGGHLFGGGVTAQGWRAIPLLISPYIAQCMRSRE
jgi:hypothetical protein